MTEEQNPISLELAQLKELEGKLEIYKSTLTEIYEQYDQKLEELSLVRRMGDALRSTSSLEDTSRSLLETVAHEVAIDRLALILNHGKKDFKLVIRAAYWADQEIFSYFVPSQGLPWSLESLGGLAPEDGLKNPLTIASASPEYDPLSRPDDPNRSIIFLPLTVHGQLLGLMVLSRPDTNPFSLEDERMLAIMGDQASSALSNVLLFDDLSRVNQRLTESESRARQVSMYLQRLLETANDAMFTLNDQGIITYANRKAAQWGFSREEMLGRELRSFMDEPEKISGWESGTPPPTDEVFEAILINAAGEPRDIILSTSRVGEDDEVEKEMASGVIVPNTWNLQERTINAFGQIYASWMILASDVTERKYLERQLIHSEKLASIGFLAAGVAHEVGNPLSAISGYAQILGAGGSSSEEQKEYLEAIVNQTDRIQKILRELLDYSRPSRGDIEILDLALALPRTMSMIQAQKVFRGIEVSYDLQDLQKENTYLVELDYDHLVQITIIIAMNAAQAMGNGNGTFHIALNYEPGWVQIHFSDNGPGISPKLLPRLFDPFFTTKKTGEGTGLGLAICQRLVDSYQGRIDVKSNPGRGTTFIISLPEYGQIE